MTRLRSALLTASPSSFVTKMLPLAESSAHSRDNANHILAAMNETKGATGDHPAHHGRHGLDRPRQGNGMMHMLLAS